MCYQIGVMVSDGGGGPLVAMAVAGSLRCDTGTAGFCFFFNLYKFLLFVILF